MPKVKAYRAPAARTLQPDVVADAARPLPAWPVNALLWGLPVWWLLGMMPFIVVVIGVVLAALMCARKELRVVAGLGPWFGLLAWMLPCVLMLDSIPRIIGYLQRGSNYVAIGIIALYLVNAREHLTAKRVITGLTAMWVFVIVGGYLGTLFPYGRLITPVGLLLPNSITSNEYVHDLVFPPFAEIQTPWGVDEVYKRPSAPFPYANSWGSAIALLTPVAFAAMTITESRKVKMFLVGCLLAAVAPAAAALNRGMLVTLAIALAYVAIRLAMRGRTLPFLALAATGAVTAGALAMFGFFTALAQRAQTGSNESRLQLYWETFTRTLESPLLGYGAPRPSNVTGLSVGTQGHVWYLMFSFGFVGLALFLWFLYGTVLRTWRIPSWGHLWLHSCVVGACFMIFFYGLGTFQLLTVVVVATLLLRARASPADGIGGAFLTHRRKPMGAVS